MKLSQLKLTRELISKEFKDFKYLNIKIAVKRMTHIQYQKRRMQFILLYNRGTKTSIDKGEY